MALGSGIGLVPMWSSCPSMNPPTFPKGGIEILRQSLEAQEEVERTFREREAGHIECLNFKKSLRHLLRKQNERREELQLVEQRASERTQALLDELLIVVRERLKAMSPEGYQSITFDNGDMYEGNWKSCRMHGTGVMRRVADNDIYEGEWFFGVRNGNGMCCSPNFGTLYSGKWLAGKWHGRGELAEPEGLYIGDFVDGQIRGYGEYLYREGYAYKGDWVNGVYEGSGTFFYTNGARYEGQWRNGYEHGRGTMTYYNGDVYTGDWCNGRKHGTGTYTSKLLQYEGGWSSGAVHGIGKCTYADGSMYKGSWCRGLYDGDGEFVSQDKKCSYKGEFRGGKRCGRGVYQCGEVEYSGDWLDDRRHGVGEIKTRDGRVFRGTWSHDEPHCEVVPGCNLEGTSLSYCGGRGAPIAPEEPDPVLNMRLGLPDEVIDCMADAPT
ncbi:hypothetical protein, conserved [Trypanosoma brucei gambiense DAL972]|uniref:MORN repeat-containing protein n=1 Tax=Trypanosoma brucei gambiense (strain MHOM/CI/86/DAL972) TaxID=679716 RepID=C9ZSQ2_TRYB9|nr:hypothetical protein, conserved [Trypanosoma brucei gambiense DAL972]CBH12436.1 hypothetical protein, conserved [Trypanosoma brucei gambiense DAL972]|eukprot:XP_011774717.1 hypothetical protein, conserved [Trypanosoma brucei gambiense DAL972]